MKSIVALCISVAFVLGCGEKLSEEEKKAKKGKALAAGKSLISVGTLKIQKHEVTVGEYALCVNAGKCKAPDENDEDYNWKKSGRERHPVNGVNWHDATAYCKWKGLRLPTEKEWEYAATSGEKDGKEYPWGTEEPSCEYAVMDDDGDGCGKGTTWPVCSKPKGNTEQGLCDMAGNVFEWTDSDKKYRVIRGGSFAYAVNLRSSSRVSSNPSDRKSSLGFRCAQ